METGGVTPYICIMNRSRFVAKEVGWSVVKIDPDGTETVIEVASEEYAKARAAALNRAAERTSEK